MIEELIKYDEEGKSTFLVYRTIAYALTASFLVAVWMFFDYFIDKRNFELFLFMRTLFVASVLAGTAIYYKFDRSIRNYKILGLFVYLMVIASILPMVFITDNMFAYFLGFSTIFFGTSIIMVWPLKYLLFPMFFSVIILLGKLWSGWPPSKEFVVGAFLVANVASISAVAGWLTYQTHIRTDELLDKLNTLSITDKLTGLYNRRFFDEELEREIAISARMGKPISMMIIDIDHFKNYNDYYGHHLGDECLKNIAICLRKSVNRKTDFIARYGGEEFAVVLRDTNHFQVREIAEKILLEIRFQRLPHQASETDNIVTVSIGTGTLTADKNTEPRELIELADDALYRAKKRGRNRIESNMA